MSTGRSELLIYIAVSLVTTIGLFVAHRWYATFLDVRYHDKLAETQPSEARLAAEEEDQKRLGSGKIPLAQAMDRLGKRGRAAASSIAPAPSDDLSALSGWIHRPGFKPATAHPVRTAPVTKPATEPAAPAAEPAPVPAPAAEPPPAAKRSIGQFGGRPASPAPSAAGSPVAR
jgi:hypothetical protein